jgi:carotenoid cleavage dioxygenase-like enzyme
MSNTNATPVTSFSAAENPYLSGNFAPVRETTATNLEVRGRIPDELNGRILQIGPNPAGPVDPTYYHWFTGTGMVHGLRLRDRKAEWYRSRFRSIPLMHRSSESHQFRARLTLAGSLTPTSRELREKSMRWSRGVHYRSNSTRTSRV